MATVVALHYAYPAILLFSFLLTYAVGLCMRKRTPTAKKDKDEEGKDEKNAEKNNKRNLLQWPLLLVLATYVGVLLSFVAAASSIFLTAYIVDMVTRVVTIPVAALVANMLLDRRDGGGIPSRYLVLGHGDDVSQTRKFPATQMTK